MNRLELLGHNCVLRGCHEDVLARIAPLIVPMDLPASAGIFRRAEPADAMALLDHPPHVVQTVAAKDSLLGRIDQPDAEEVLRLTPHVVPLNFVRAVHRRVTAAKIFGPFFTHSESAGTGLGMAMARTFVDAHHGTKFVVKIPLAGSGQAQLL